MPQKMSEKKIKDSLKNDTLDLSYCELQEVPVQKIVTIKKARTLDLSNNLLIELPQNFILLTQIIKLDLSKNLLHEIPENFGQLERLKHLDLYGNQISRLPLSLCKLKNLRWLDLKENPLTPAVAEIAGPCSNSQECQACARNVVSYLCNVEKVIEEERSRIKNATTEQPAKRITTKKENKQKKKHSMRNESTKNSEDIDELLINDDENTSQLKESLNGALSVNPSTDNCCNVLGRGLASILMYILIFGGYISLMIWLIPSPNEHKVDGIFENFKLKTSLFLKFHQKYIWNAWNKCEEVSKIWMRHSVDAIYKYIEG